MPNLSHLLTNTEPEAENTCSGSPTSTQNTEAGKAKPPDTDAGAEPGREEVLAICRAVFETSLGWDDVFADNGGHSIVIARLAQRLQTEGWAVPVRALLSNCDTPRKVANLPRKRQQATTAATNPHQKATERDETAARVLSVGYFTIRQVLFLCLLYSPPLIGFIGLIAFAEISEFFITASLWEFIGVGFLMYLFALVSPFCGLLWVMVIKRCLGGDLYRNNISPGIYPRWSRMHLRTWYIGRLERSVLVPLRTMFRSAPLMSFALQQLGTRVGDNLQCAHDADFSGPLDLLSVEDLGQVTARLLLDRHGDRQERDGGDQWRDQNEVALDWA